MDSSQKIIFFDGYCGLCDRFVTEIFLKDKKHVFHFAPLQGPTASKLQLKEIKIDSVVYYKSGKTYLKSQAVLEIFKDLGGFYSLFGVLKIIPVSLRDLAYDFIARNRYGWFGQTQSCRLPSESEKAYFLD